MAASGVNEARRAPRPRWGDWYRAVADLARQADLPPAAYAGPTGQGDEYVHALFKDGVTAADAVQWIKDRHERRERMAHAVHARRRRR